MPGRWDRFIGHEVSDVQLRYRPWAAYDDGYWCTRVTITVRGSDIHLLGGQAEAGQALAPSADNIAVLFRQRLCRNGNDTTMTSDLQPSTAFHAPRPADQPAPIRWTRFTARLQRESQLTAPGIPASPSPRDLR